MRGGKGSDLARIASEVWDDLAVTPDERKLAATTIESVAANRAQLDSDLAEVTTNWRLTAGGPA